LFGAEKILKNIKKLKLKLKFDLYANFASKPARIFLKKSFVLTQ